MKDDLFETGGALPEEPAEESPQVRSEKRVPHELAKEHVSAWIKSLRLERLQDSMYWLNIMSQSYDDWYVARRMAAFAGEDCWDTQAVVLTSALWTLIERKVPDVWNHIYYVNWYLCHCPKFWNTEGGLDVGRALMELEKRYADDGQGGIKPEPAPSWAIDLHTPTGREAAKNKQWDMLDRRFSGDEIGILTRILMFKRLGRLDPDGGMEDYWKAYNILKKNKGE